MPTVRMVPLCVKVADINRRGKRENRNREMAYGELISYLVGPYFSIAQFTCNLVAARGAVVTPLCRCSAHII